jgi:hypothetical protein
VLRQVAAWRCALAAGLCTGLHYLLDELVPNEIADPEGPIFDSYSVYFVQDDVCGTSRNLSSGSYG